MKGKSDERLGKPSARATPHSEWDFCSIGQLSKALQSRDISASELLEHTIARIEGLDERINAVVVRDFARADRKSVV